MLDMMKNKMIGGFMIFIVCILLLNSYSIQLEQENKIQDLAIYQTNN